MAHVSGKYLELIRSFPLRPIRTNAELARAEAVIEQLVDANLTPAEADYLLILGNLIEEYENANFAIEPLPAHEMLAASIQAKDVTQTEVAKATGIPVSTISELISQKREFNVSHIEKLCAYFGLGPGAFIHVDNKVMA
jgi:HTH-type transcriptional regulator/antitoxin HigA